MSDLSRFLKDVEEDVSDIWHSDAAKIIVPAVIGLGAGGLIGGTAAAAATGGTAGASYGLSSFQQEKAIEEAEKMQEKQIAAQKEMQEKQIELETLKMEEQKQLMDVFTTQDQPLYFVPPDIVTPAPIKAPVNYLLYIAIGIGILIYLGKIKL